ncbi:MAG: hypothetical protein JST54_18685 [Deltaproteobacteria bacterium]|nr:hypothetical protein [Deltaproteobacteria bacterium]
MSHSLWAGKQEEDKLQVGPAFVVLAITVAIMIFTYEGVRHYTNGITAHHPRVAEAETRHVSIQTNGEPAENSPVPQFGMLHQTLFETVSDAKDLNALSNARLNSYGWVDEQKTVAHIPIARAMEIVVKQRAAQAQQQQPQQAPTP